MKLAAWPLIAACCGLQCVCAKVPSRVAEVQKTECATAEVNRTDGIAELRSLIDRCKETPSIAMDALVKLNMSPLPQPPRLTTVAKADGAGSEVVGIESVVYFGTGETYPSDDGLQQLAELIARINESGSTVQSIVVVGGVDATEAASPIARDIARGRAETIRRYFLTAGVEAAAVRVALRGPGTPSAGPTAATAAERVAVVALVVRRPLRATADSPARPNR